MIPIDKSAIPIVHDFMRAQEKTDMLALKMVRVGVNPYYAWMYVRDVNPEKLADILDISCQFDDVQGMPLQSNASIIDQIARGLVTPNAQTVLAFCEALGITPDQLARPRYPHPVASEIVEAAVLYVQSYRAHRKIPDRLIEFLQDESHKADKFGELMQDPFRGANTDYLLDIDSSYAANHLSHEGVLLQEVEAPVETIFEMLENRVAIYEEDLESDLALIAAGVAEHEFAWNDAHADFWRVAEVLAPQNQAQQWMEAFYGSIHDHGVARTRENLNANPEALYPLQFAWKLDFVHLRNGRVYRGEGLLDLAVDQYERYDDATSALNDMKRRQERAITELLDFRQWRHTSETAHYLKAEAHRRHIRGYMDAEELGETNADMYEPVAPQRAKKGVLRP